MMAAFEGSKRPQASTTLPPRKINVKKFTESRGPELEALHSIVADRLSNNFKSRRNKRRRTTAYDNQVARKRCRKRRKLGGEVDKGNALDGDKEKKVPRRVRRRVELRKNPENGFGTSGDGTKRMRTHVWHAKRFTMTKLWGFYLPLGLQGR
jgi:ribonuclease P/MRP protein subunit POP1